LEIHLDLIGGLAGDMFVAAVLDAFPEHEPLVQAAVGSMSGRFPVACMVAAHNSHGLKGSRFQVLRVAAPAGSHPHRCWQSIRQELEAAGLTPAVRTHAIALFELLAQAEAAVHGVDPEAVDFHEVGAWDSIADVVAAAALIDALRATRWTSSPVPLGSGRVETAHGILPLPAPATVRLLNGWPTLDDGIGGERVTPTGAAILRYLCGPDSGASGDDPPVRRLRAAGIGFGTRLLNGIANHVRLICFEGATARLSDGAAAHLTGRRLHALEFEVDDQAPEDLAAGLERLRAHAGVLDVTQAPVFGKKGRMMAAVRVLARAQHVDAVIEACFRETTTIGLRHRSVYGVGLERCSHEVRVDGELFRVKVVARPGGLTAKTEADDVLEHAGHARRAALRTHAEQEVLRSLRSAPLPVGELRTAPLSPGEVCQ
jgi:uncharacterized protein (TIGR00299 family) protein